MKFNYDEVVEGEADIPFKTKGRRVGNFDSEKINEKESGGEKASKIRLKLKHFVEGQGRPWNNEKLTQEERSEANLKYTQFINSFIHAEIIVLDDSLFKESLTKSGKIKFTHETTTIFCVKESRQEALEEVKKLVTGHISQWKDTSIEFRQQFGII